MSGVLIVSGGGGGCRAGSRFLFTRTGASTLNLNALSQTGHPTSTQNTTVHYHN